MSLGWAAIYSDTSTTRCFKKLIMSWWGSLLNIVGSCMVWYETVKKTFWPHIIPTLSRLTWKYYFGTSKRLFPGMYYNVVGEIIHQMFNTTTDKLHLIPRTCPKWAVKWKDAFIILSLKLRLLNESCPKSWHGTTHICTTVCLLMNLIHSWRAMS